MKRLKKFFKALFFPHLAIVVLITALAALSFIYSAISLPPTHHISVISYVLSAYAIALVACALPDLIARVRALKEKKNQIKKLRFDAQLRITLLLYGTFFYNSVYAIFQLFLGLSHRSVWYLSLAAYYILLAIMRFSLLLYSRSNKAGDDLISELKRFRFCGALLLLMNAALSAITFYITWKNQEFSHHGATAVALAAFTICSFAMSIINVIRYRKLNSPLLFAAKLISFVAAIVSMLSLESALVGRLGANLNDGARQIITGVSGFAVLAIINYIGIFMVVKGNKSLKKFTNE